ncbi:hypothetical protein ACI2KR_08890 [Pseudomonas luteola]
MRLISRFHDYYDSFTSYGIDPNVTYVRKTEHHSVRYSISHASTTDETVRKAWKAVIRPLYLSTRYSEPFESRLCRGFVGFCGKLFPFVKVFVRKPKVGPSLFAESDDMFKAHFLYSFEDVEKFLSSNPSHPAANRLIENKSKVFECLKTVEHHDIFMETEAPCVVCDDHEFYVNPRLEDYSFPRIKDGLQAFQEISAYISGALNAKDQLPPYHISDADMASSKGFGEMSFRKEPQKRRVR